LNTLDLKKFLLPESNEVDDVNKANSNETVYASDPLPVTDTSTDTPCPSEVEHIVNTVCVS
jgi:hypothetical protein